jgi:hypothetical protein
MYQQWRRIDDSLKQVYQVADDMDLWTGPCGQSSLSV